MVQRDQWDTYWGPKKYFIKVADDAAMVQSGRAGGILSIPAQRSPWDCLGSGLYTVSRLHRMRRRFQHILANSLNMITHLSMNYLAMASRALGGPQVRRMRHRRLPTTRPTPRGLQESICPRKKRAIWTRWRPVPVKNVNYPRPPVVAVAVSSEPILPQR